MSCLAWKLLVAAVGTVAAGGLVFLGMLVVIYALATVVWF